MGLGGWLLVGAAWAWVGTPGSSATDHLDPSAPGDRAEAVRLLCADSSVAACPLGQRIAAAEWLRQHPTPAAAPALLRVFARSRFGALPEDPDLFERALRGVAALPLEDQRLAVATGLAPGLVDLTWHRLVTRWLKPLAPQSSPEVLRALQGWPTAHATEWQALTDALVRDLVDAFDQQPEVFLHGLSTEGGSLAEAAAQRAEDALLASLLASNNPAVAELALAVVVGGPRGGPLTRAGLDAVAHNPAIGPAARDAARSPVLHNALPAELPPLTVPPLPPATLPGAQARPPDRPLSDFVTVRSSRRRSAPLGWAGLAGVLFVGGAIVGTSSRTGAIRAAAALAMGVAVPIGAEAGLQLAGAPAEVDEGPLFSFYKEDKALLTPHPSATSVVSPGGPVRHQAVAWPEPPGNLRIATVGASTAHGSHYLVEEAFSHRVADALRPHWSGPVDALNLSIGGARTDAARRAGMVALDHGADLLVVCIGHNEAAAFATLGRWDPRTTRLLEVQLRLSHSTLFHAVAQLVPALRGHPSPQPTPPTRDDTAGLLDLAEANLAWNLSPLFEEAHRRGVPVILVIPPTNWRFALLEPWTTPGPGDATDLARRMRAAEAAADRGDGAAARAAAQGAIDVSASPRELTAALKARLLMLARDQGVTVVRGDTLFDAWAPDGLTPSGLFWDDLHPTRAGHALLAEAIALAAAEVLALPTEPFAPQPSATALGLPEGS